MSAPDTGRVKGCLKPMAVRIGKNVTSLDLVRYEMREREQLALAKRATDFSIQQAYIEEAKCYARLAAVARAKTGAT